MNIYNQLPAPWYFDGVQALLGPGRADFTAAYAFDIRPATDNRPYFQNFFRWSVLTEAWRAKDRGGMALLEAGYLLLVTTLVQALLAGLLLILLPLVLFAPLARTNRRLRWQVFAYFAGDRARLPVRRDCVPAEADAPGPPSDRCAVAGARDVPARGRRRQRLVEPFPNGSESNPAQSARSPVSCCSAPSTAQRSTR